MEGEATLWESRHLLNGQDEKLAREFEAQAEGSYRAILSALKRRRPDLTALSRQYQQTLARDHFRCVLGKQVRKALLAAKGEADS